MAQLVFCTCGLHVSLQIAGEKRDRVEAVRTFIQDEINKHYRLGDISPAEKKALTEEVKTHPALFNTAMDMLNALVTEYPHLAKILKTTEGPGPSRLVVVIATVQPQAEA
jgi:hypothetical protein